MLLLIGFLSTSTNGETVTTDNLLSNSTFGTGTTYSDTGWTISGYDSSHNYISSAGGNDPGGAMASGKDTNIEQTVGSIKTAAGMTVNEIRKGWSSTMSTDIWYWNSENNTTTLKQTITDNEGNVSTQQRVITDTGCGSYDCGQYTNYTDTHIQGTNTKDDFSIKVGVSNSNSLSGHYGPDIDDIQLKITYTDVPPIEEDTQEELDEITEDIDDVVEDIEDNIVWEEDWTFEEDYAWEEDFYFEEEFEMNWEEFDTTWEEYEMDFNDEMYFEEEFTEFEEEFDEVGMPEFEEFETAMMPEDSFEEMYMEEFEEFETFEDAFMDDPEDMEMPEEFEEMEVTEEFDTSMEMEEEEFEEMEMEEEFDTSMEMEEEFEEMEMAEEETVDMEMEEEDVVEMEGEDENEEMEVTKDEESMEDTEETDEETDSEVAEESDPEESAQEVAANEEEEIGEDDIDAGEVTDSKITFSKDIKIGKVEVGEIKVAINPRDIFKESVSLDSYSSKDFYKDEGLDYAVNDDFFDQLSMIEYSKEIYKGITLVMYIQGDPVQIYRQELEELAIQKAGIMIELDILRGNK